MTTIFQEKKKCTICGETSEHASIGSTSAWGHDDLDTRPPELERSTINMWIQTCPPCGYCSPDISKSHGQSSEVIRSDFYQQQLSSPQLPKLASAFLCFSLIEESAGEHASAGWACIHAAWACDDAGYGVGAQECRKKAVIFLQKAKEACQGFSTQAGAEEAIMADLLRRSGQFELALKTCDDGLNNKKSEKIILDILRYQKTLIRKRDIACHSISEVHKEEIK